MIQAQLISQAYYTTTQITEAKKKERKRKKISTLEILVGMQLHHAQPAALLLQAVPLPVFKY